MPPRAFDSRGFAWPSTWGACVSEIDGFFERGYVHGYDGRRFTAPTSPEDAALEPFCHGYARGMRDRNLGHLPDVLRAWERRY